MHRENHVDPFEPHQATSRDQYVSLYTQCRFSWFSLFRLTRFQMKYYGRIPGFLRLGGSFFSILESGPTRYKNLTSRSC